MTVKIKAIESVSHVRREAMRMLRDAWRLLRRWWWVVAVVAAVTGGVAFWLSGWDVPLYDATHRHEKTHPRMEALAGGIRDWGVFIDTATFAVVFFGGGMWLKRVAWKRAALACLLAGVVAGVAATTLRATTGRPRPGKRYRYDLADSWTGPTLDDRYQSFPSGHTATSVGAAVAVCIVVPAATPLMALNATVMAGASLYDGKHYLTDVLVGSAFGVVLGVPIGVAARRRKCLFGEIG